MASLGIGTRARSVRWLLFALGALAACAAPAAPPPASIAVPTLPPPAAADPTPPALRPWVDWVLHDAPQARCPRINGDGERACVFPSSLLLAIDDGGAAFRIEAAAYSVGAELVLPGQPGSWPVDVRLDGAAVPVTGTEGQPRLLLPFGSHRVEGRIGWQRMPAQLALPPGYASVSITLRGRALLPDDAGIVWLAQAAATPAESDTATTRIFRRVVDDIPALVDTRIELTVAGKAREIVVPQALLPGFVPLLMTAPLPARLDDRALRIQAVPGKHVFGVRARQTAPLAALTLPAALPAAVPATGVDAGAGDHEIWSFAAVDDLRRVDVQGAVQVDPRQADVPAEWQALPAWRLAPGESLRITERSRGQAGQGQGQGQDRTTLTRTLWLDEDGAGLTFRDRVQGVFVRGTALGTPGAAGAGSDAGGGSAWRLTMRPPYALGRASLNGQDQVLTRLAADQPAGIELRGAELRLEADGRVLEANAALPVSGWSTDLQQASAVLNVPPGWRLVHASGVDAASGAWTARWTLWDLFFALLICFAAARVFGWLTGAVLGAALALCWTVPGAPGWWWLLPIAAAAIERAAAGHAIGRAAALVRRAGFAIVGIAIVAFSVGQIRGALHPVLEDGPGRAASGVAQDALAPAAPAPAEMNEAAEAAPEPPASIAADAGEAPSRGGLDMARSLRKNVPQSVRAKVQQYEAVDPAARVQTGPGVPTWQWRAYPLRWSGPVKADQQLRLWLAPPWLTRLGSLATVALLLVELWLMVGRPRHWPGPPRASAPQPPRPPQSIRPRQPPVSEPPEPSDPPTLQPIAGSALAAHDAGGTAIAQRIGDAGNPLPQGSGANAHAGDGDRTPLTLRVVSFALAALLCGGAGFAPAAARAQVSSAAELAAAPSSPPRKVPAPGVDSAESPVADSAIALLPQLRERLLEPPRCAPHCASIGRLTVSARGDLVTLWIEIHAQADAAVRLPGGAAWRAARNEMDGRPGEFVEQGDHQVLARVTAGVHITTRTLSAGTLGEIPVALPVPPGRLELSLDDWQATGVRDDGTVENMLTLVRVKRSAAPGANPATAQDAGVVPFARVERTLKFGARWQVDTSVRRLDTGTRPLEVRIPLLPGEAVTAASTRVVDGVALVSVPPGAGVEFSAELPATRELELTATREPAQVDVWTLEASTLWNVSYTGAPPVRLVRDGLWSPQWRPWPGEAIKLTLQRPAAVPGATLTIDDVQLRTTPGKAATDTHATLVLRASLGGTHRLELPEGGKLLTLRKDGRDLPVYAESRAVPIAIEPGTHRIELSWREERGVTTQFHVPQLGLGGPAVNARVDAVVPADRWLLFPIGPTIGPVALFWSLLVVVLALALAAARWIGSPLSVAGWIVLAVGAGQAGLAPVLMVLAFIGVVSLRERFGARLAGWKFNAMQLGFVLFALAAVVTLLEAIHNGLLGRPTMLVAGNGSSDTLLRWYVDRAPEATPQAAIVSLPLWIWRLLMLAWSVWLALTVVRVAAWVWHAFSAGGRWRKLARRVPKAPPQPPPQPSSAPPSPLADGGVGGTGAPAGPV